MDGKAGPWGVKVSIKPQSLNGQVGTELLYPCSAFDVLCSTEYEKHGKNMSNGLRFKSELAYQICQSLAVLTC